MPPGRPHLQFRVTARAQLQERVLAAIVKLDAREVLRVAAIEAFGKPENRSQPPDVALALPRQLTVAVVAELGRRPAVIARHERDDLDFLRVESAQIAVLDQVVRMLMVPLVADVHSDVMQELGVLEPFAMPIAERVDHARLIEQRGGQPRHLRGVLGPVVAALRQLDDAAAPNVGIAVGLRDLLPVARHVIEDEALAQ